MKVKYRGKIFSPTKKGYCAICDLDGFGGECFYLCLKLNVTGHFTLTNSDVLEHENQF